MKPLPVSRLLTCRTCGYWKETTFFCYKGANPEPKKPTDSCGRYVLRWSEEE